MMKRLFLLALLLPCAALANISGVDDANSKLKPEQEKVFDAAMSTYYQSPSVEKVNTVLDMMNNTDILLRKSAWNPIIGFLTIVFATHKEHVFDWMSLYDYNSHAQDVFIAALMHAGLPEAAYVFAQAHQWKDEELNRMRAYRDHTDFTHYAITLPGHIDELWGAFFASGDAVYVNEIIDVLYLKELPVAAGMAPDAQTNLLGELKKLARNTLTQYAAMHAPVRDAIAARLRKEKSRAAQKELQQLLPKAK